MGYYLTDKNISDLGVTIRGESITPDIYGIAETLYLLKLGSLKPRNYYLEEIRADFERGKTRHIDKLVTDLKALKERLHGIRYEIQDMRTTIAEWKDNETTFIFIDPPLFSGMDYVKMFDSDIIQWCEPNIAQFHPKTDFEPLMAESQQAKATITVYLRENNNTDGVTNGWHSFFAHQDQKTEAEYLYVNKNSNFILTKRPKPDNPQRLPYPILSDQDEITERSKISIVHINHEQAMYYRDLFVHRLGVSQAELNILFLVDEKIFSVRGLMYFRSSGQDFTVTEIFGLVHHNTRYRHLGRLAMRIVTSNEFMQAITPQNELFPKRYITSTTLSKYPVAREDKGLLELYNSSYLKKINLYRLEYKTIFKDKNYKDCLIEWLNEEKGYGKEQRRKKKRIRTRQRNDNKTD